MEITTNKNKEKLVISFENDKTTIQILHKNNNFDTFQMFNRVLKALEFYQKDFNRFNKFFNAYLNLFKAEIKTNQFKIISSDDIELLEINTNMIVFKSKNDGSKNLEVSENTIDICNGKYTKVEKTNITGIDGLLVYLKSTTKVRTQKTFYTTSHQYSFDIETNTIENDCRLVSFSLADNRHYWAYTTTTVQENDRLIEHFFNLVEILPKSHDKKSNLDKISFDVHNLKFDISFILTYLLKRGFKCVQYDNKIQLKENEISLIYNQGIIKCNINYKNIIIEFFDTYRIMSMSLDKISSIIDSDLIIRKSKTEYDYTKSKDIGYKLTKNEIVYCINDVIVLSHIKEYFSKILWGKLKLTNSSTAYSEWVLSTRFGMYNTKILKYTATLFHKHYKNFKNMFNYFVKNGYYNDYYNEHVKAPNNFDDFVKDIYNNDITKSEIENFCFSRSLVFNYLKTVKKWSTDFILEFMFFSLSQKQRKKQDEIVKEAIDYYLPPLTYQEDKNFRPAYGGGITAPNLTQIGYIHENITGASIDINSSYPYKCRCYPLPIKKPQEITGDLNAYLKQILNKNDGRLYLIDCRISVRLKTGHLPILINQNCKFRTQTQISNGIVDKLLTLDEIKTVLNTYHTIILKVKKIYKFECATFLFSAYYDRYFQIKKQSKGTAFYDISKVLLNGLYGKFGENLFIREKEYTIAELKENTLHYTTIKLDDKDINLENVQGKYIFTAIFITSFSRCQLINACNEICESGGNLFYTDTDSIYFSATNIDVKENKLAVNNHTTSIEIDSKKLGAWDLEHKFKKIYVTAPKRYAIQDTDGKITIKCAGVSKNYTKDFAFTDIAYKAIHKSLQQHITKNGLNLVDVYKGLSYSENVYLTTDGDSVTLPVKGNVGQKVKNVYGETKTIKSIIYEKEF